MKFAVISNNDAYDATYDVICFDGISSFPFKVLSWEREEDKYVLDNEEGEAQTLLEAVEKSFSRLIEKGVIETPLEEIIGAFKQAKLISLNEGKKPVNHPAFNGGFTFKS